MTTLYRVVFSPPWGIARCLHVLMTRKGQIIFSLWKGAWGHVQRVWSVQPGLEHVHLFSPFSCCSCPWGKQKGAGAMWKESFSSSLSLSQSSWTFHLLPLLSASFSFPAHHTCFINPWRIQTTGVIYLWHS